MGTPKDSEKTRAKLIEAAGRLFAEKGYKSVTVREIAQKSDTHLSALNYHFRTKEALYREVLLEACKADVISQEDQILLLRLNPREALFQLVKGALKEYRRQSASNWQTVLTARECREPGPAFEEVVQAYLKPDTEFIAGILSKITGQPPDSREVSFAVISMTALVETFGLYGHLIDGVAPGLTKYVKKKDWVAKRITRLVIEAASSPQKG